MSASFDDPNLVSAAGLVPILRLADTAGLTTLAKDRLTIPTDKGANAGAKITTLIAGMVAGADSIDDMDQLRHGGMNNLFSNIYAPSTLGSFLRSFVFGHVRQLDAIASRFLAGLATQAPALVPAVPRDGEQAGGYVFVDIDDALVYKRPRFGLSVSTGRGFTLVFPTCYTYSIMISPLAASVARADFHFYGEL